MPLDDDEMEWFDAPLGYANGNGESDKPGPEVLVTAEFAGGIHKWNGRIVRTQGRIDPTSRMVNVVAEVENPFKETNDNVPLTPGMFVSVEIKGKLLSKIIRLPRYAVRGTDEVWLAVEGKIKIQKVKIARRDKTHAYISSGISDGDIVITSPLDIVTDGMKIRTRLDEAGTGEESEK